MTRRAWQRMLSGRRLDLLDPTPLDIEIEDIAHGLSFLVRWNGQTRGDHGYSVAEHSILVEEIFNSLNPDIDPKWKMAALLHDAAEYVIGDLISPVKSSVGQGYGLLENRLMKAIFQRFGVDDAIPKTIQQKIKLADRLSAWLEAIKIADFTVTEANKIFGRPKTKIFNDIQIIPKPPLRAKSLFLKKHAEINKLM
mgnify:FL=1